MAKPVSRVFHQDMPPKGGFPRVRYVRCLFTCRFRSSIRPCVNRCGLSGVFTVGAAHAVGLLVMYVRVWVCTTSVRYKQIATRRGPPGIFIVGGAVALTLFGMYNHVQHKHQERCVCNLLARLCKGKAVPD